MHGPRGNWGAGAALLLLSAAGALAQVAELSFAPPFTAVSEHSGSREVPGWGLSGDATALKNFVRLTPDRQSKRGNLWCEAPVPSGDFTVELKFRLSGQGKTLFGDGLALWVTTDAYHAPGDFHGARTDFKGFAVVFDTFKNTEAGHTHRDVAVYTNDGSKQAEELLSSVTGCDASMRYHEKRADFSVTNATKAKIMFLEAERSITILIDERASGEYKECVKLSDVEFPDEWSEKKHFGLTATTGALADNHDVLSFQAFRNEQEHQEHQINNPAQESGSSELTDLVHSLEHHITATNDALQVNVQKLRKQEKALEDRVNVVEQSLKEQMVQTLEQRVAGLEGLNLEKLAESERTLERRIMSVENTLKDDFHRKLDSRIRALEDLVEHKITERIKFLENALGETIDSRVESGHRFSYFLFFGVFLTIGILSTFIYRKYRWLQKQHLL